MNGNRIKYILLHTWYHLLHSLETWVDVLWNPAIQLWVYSLIALSFSGQGDARGVNVLIGMIFFQIIWVGEYAVTVGALWEIWAQSFSGLFITPLTMREFIVGQMISGAIKSILAVAVCSLMAFGLYRFSIFSIGWMLPIYYIQLLVFAWASGLMVLSLIFRYSTQVQSLSWTLIFLVQPFGAVFYPVSVLPVSIRWVSYGLPVTYVFETIRGQVATHMVDWQALGVATALNIVWMVVGWAVFTRTYAAAKQSGAFARLEG